MSAFAREENSSPLDGIFGPLMPLPRPFLRRPLQQAPPNIMAVGREEEWSEKERLHNKVNTLLFEKSNMASELESKEKEIKELKNQIRRYEEIGCKVADAHLMFLGLTAKPGGAVASPALWGGLLPGLNGGVVTVATCVAVPNCSTSSPSEDTTEQPIETAGSGSSLHSNMSDLAHLEELD